MMEDNGLTLNQIHARMVCDGLDLLANQGALLAYTCRDEFADALGAGFNEWDVSIYTHHVIGTWLKLGCPEPEGLDGGSITDRMAGGIWATIANAGVAGDAADEAIGKYARLVAEDLRAWLRGDDVAETLADALDEADAQSIGDAWDRLVDAGEMLDRVRSIG